MLDVHKNTAFFITLLVGSWLLGLAGEIFYTPVMPSISTALHVPAQLVKLTISYFILGKAISMFLCSPITDAFGRKQFILFGLGLFSAGSLLCYLCPGINMLLFGRLLQGLGSSICILMGRAIINDSFESNRAANMFSYIFIGNAIGIIFLPILGGYVAAFAGWRTIFLILTLYSLIIIACILRFLPETHPNASLSLLKTKTILKNYQTVIKNTQFWGFVLCLVFVMSGEKAYTTSAAFLFIQKAGLSKVTYGYLTAAMWTAHLIGTLICGRIVLKHGIDRIMAIGILIASLPAVILMLLTWSMGANIYLFAVCIFIYMLGTGFVITLSAVGIVRPFPKLIGFSTAFAMWLEFIFAALISFGISYYSSSITPVANTIGVMGILTFIAWFTLIRSTRPIIK